MRRITIITLLIFNLLMARQLPQQDVRAAVITWVRYVAADARPDATIECLEPYIVDGETLAYIAHLNDSGFCLCGTYDFVLPVYFYSPAGTYDSDNSGLSVIMREIVERTNIILNWKRTKSPELKKYNETFKRKKEIWENLISGKNPYQSKKSKSTEEEPENMVLGLTCKWSQDSPFNNMCPELTPGSGRRCPVGCCPLAAAQVMYYWKWPTTGEGVESQYDYYKHSDAWQEEPLFFYPFKESFDPTNWKWDNRFTWEDNRLKMRGYWDWSLKQEAKKQCDTLTSDDSVAYTSAIDTIYYNKLISDSTLYTVNFGSTTYNWSLMADRASQLSSAGSLEVAKLCFHCGVAMKAGWGILGTGSNLYKVKNGMKEHFRYDDDAVSHWDTVAIDFEDIDTITMEIQWLRPVIVASKNHCFIVYGYDKTTDPNRQFMMNMGWGGGADGWYVYDGGPAGQIFGYIHYLAPEDVVRFVGATSGSNEGSPADPYHGIEDAIADSADIPSNSTLIFKAGSDNTFLSSSIKIDFPVILKSYDAVIRHN